MLIVLNIILTIILFTNALVEQLHENLKFYASYLFSIYVLVEIQSKKIIAQ